MRINTYSLITFKKKKHWHWTRLNLWSAHVEHLRSRTLSNGVLWKAERLTVRLKTKKQSILWTLINGLISCLMNQTQPKMATTKIECLQLVMHPNYGNKNIQLKWQKEKLIFISSIFGGPKSLFETVSASPLKCFDCQHLFRTQNVYKKKGQQSGHTLPWPKIMLE